MTTAYTLRTSRILKSGKHPIMIRIYAGGSQTQISSGYSVHLDDWDPERNAPLELKRTSKRKTSLDNIATNLRLTVARLTEKAEELQSALPGFTAKQLVQYDKGELKVKAGKMKQQSFLDWIHDHLETFDKVTMSGTARVGRTSTKMKYLSQLRVLKQFSEETGEALTWENMDADFCKKMRAWRVSKPAGFMGKGGSSQQRVSIGTVNKWVKTVKLWIAKARDMGVHTYDHHRHPEWTVREGEILRFALSAQQLKDFFAYQIPPGTRGDTSRKGLKRCRDLFVVQCCTGVRISDLPQIIKQYNSDPTRDNFQVAMTKTQRMVEIPVLPMLHQVAARYDGKLPEIGAVQRYNKLLKQAAQLSGLFDGKLVKPAVDDRGLLDPVETTQWKEISSHTARRSFATIALDSGVPPHVVMAITGHKQESNFRKYVVTNADEVAALLREKMSFG